MAAIQPPRGRTYEGCNTLEEFLATVKKNNPNNSSEEQLAEANRAFKSHHPKPGKTKKAGKAKPEGNATLSHTDLRTFRGMEYDDLVAFIGKLQVIADKKLEKSLACDEKALAALTARIAAKKAKAKKPSK